MLRGAWRRGLSNAPRVNAAGSVNMTVQIEHRKNGVMYCVPSLRGTTIRSQVTLPQFGH